MLANISPHSIEALAFSSTISVSILWKFLSNVPTSIDNLCANFPSQSLASRFVIWPTSSVTPGI